MGAARYLKVCLMSMICSVAVLVVTNSGWLASWNTTQQVFKLASIAVVVITALPSGSGMSSERISWT